MYTAVEGSGSSYRINLQNNSQVIISTLLKTGLVCGYIYHLSVLVPCPVD